MSETHTAPERIVLCACPRCAFAADAFATRHWPLCIADSSQSRAVRAVGRPIDGPRDFRNLAGPFEANLPGG